VDAAEQSPAKDERLSNPTLRNHSEQERRDARKLNPSRRQQGSRASPMMCVPGGQKAPASHRCTTPAK